MSTFSDPVTGVLPSRRSTWQSRPGSGEHAGRALAISAALWWSVAIAGQMIFAAYVVVFYGGSAASHHLERWSRVLSDGWVPGHFIGNATLAMHVFFAALVLASGGLQLLPVVRRRAPVVHRWNGRFYVVAAVWLAASGLAMVGAGRAPGDLSQHLASALNAAAIFVFAGLAWRDARARRFDSHKRWALRLLLAVAGVWFFRIGLMAWIMLNHGPAGFDPKTFSGPALTLLAFGQTLLPLAVLEATLRARRRAGEGARLAMAVGIGATTLATLLGIAAATLIMWLPHMRG
jgi:MFS family permease